MRKLEDLFVLVFVSAMLGGLNQFLPDSVNLFLWAFTFGLTYSVLIDRRNDAEHYRKLCKRGLLIK